MKPTYQGFTAKERKGFLELPQAGCYVAEIQNVKVEPSYDKTRDVIVCMMEIIEGDYKNRYHEVFADQQNRFDKVSYKGLFRLVPPIEGDEPWKQTAFENNLWCVQESNPGYSWDWDEKKLKGKRVGINVRDHLYTYNGAEKSAPEIAKFETVNDVRDGKCKPAKARDTRDKDGNSGSYTASGSGEPDELSFTDVSQTVEVPF